MKRNKIVEIICALLVLLFLYTGLSKLLNQHSFIRDMYNQPFPEWLVKTIIYSLPASECIIAALLCFERTRRAALWLSLVVMLLFTTYTAMVLLNFFGRTPCGCGGIIRTLSWKQHLVFNIIFTILPAIALIITRQSKNSSRP